MSYRKRLNDSLTFRVSTEQRQFLEQVANAEGISLGEAGRILLEAGANALGISREDI